MSSSYYHANGFLTNKSFCLFRGECLDPAPPCLEQRTPLVNIKVNAPVAVRRGIGDNLFSRRQKQSPILSYNLTDRMQRAVMHCLWKSSKFKIEGFFFVKNSTKIISRYVGIKLSSLRF